MLFNAGKYRSFPSFAVAWLYREWRRQQIAGFVTWNPPTEDELRPGCTAIIGMCHHLPSVLLANLACLGRNRWPGLHEVIIVVDSVAGCLPVGFEDRARAAADGLAVRFLYYPADQARHSDRVRLPYLYAWLSWAIGIRACRTATALLHDYDALILDNGLGRRFDAFVASGAKMQGIRWYDGGGIIHDDRLATTFEAFLDVRWVRQHPAVRMFNKVAKHRGRTVDFDTLLEMQARCADDHARTIEPMGADSLVHPSQMVHQFTMARRAPGAPLPVFSLPMIPFFEWLGGDGDALARASERIDRAKGSVVPFFDGIAVDFAMLQPDQVAWCLKQMLQACEALGIDPGPQLYDYGWRLYRLAGADEAVVWTGDFTASQGRWIEDTAARAVG